MYSEFDVRIGNSDKKIFMDMREGRRFGTQVSHIHTHAYTEIHVCLKGIVELDICGEKYSLDKGSVLAVPKGVLHACTRADEENLHLVFLLDGEVKKPQLITISGEIAEAVVKAAVESVRSGNCSLFASYISLICNPFFEKEILKPQKSDDYSLITGEFFSLHYADDYTLCDLADMLHLSKKQTERIVMTYTGKTFKENMADKKSEIARILLEEGKMTKKEIAEYVGYSTYSGFWKAVAKTAK